MTDRQLEKARLLGIAPEEFEPSKNNTNDRISDLEDAISILAEMMFTEGESDD